MNKIHIEISPEDIYLEDSELFLKLWNKVMEENEIIPDNSTLTQLINNKINEFKGRVLCPVCQGNMRLMIDCYCCNRRGYIS